MHSCGSSAGRWDWQQGLHNTVAGASAQTAGAAPQSAVPLRHLGSLQLTLRSLHSPWALLFRAGGPML